MATSVGRGEVRVVDLGHAGKRRPCLVVSIPAADTERALAVIVPGTTAVRGARFEAKLNLRALAGRGVSDAQNLQAVPLARFESKSAAATPEQMTLVEDAVRPRLGL